jgi:uncharacterized membrane protein (DUF106 family)
VEILEILKVGGTAKVQISDEEYEYDSLDEIEKRAGTRLKELSFLRLSPHLRVHISSAGTSLYSIETEHSLADMVRIDELLKSRKRPLLTRLLHPASLFIFLALLTAGVVKAQSPGFARDLNIASSALILGMLYFCYRVGTFSQVFLTYKHEDKSFWARNRDNIVIVIITAIITGVITVVASYFLFKQGIK